MGSCGNDSQVIKLAWDNKENATNTLIIVFEKNVTNNHFMIQNINLTVIPSNESFPFIKGKFKPHLQNIISILLPVNRFMVVITGLLFDMGMICFKCVNHLSERFINEFHEQISLPSHQL
jgi:hypothetical protein